MNGYILLILVLVVIGSLLRKFPKSHTNLIGYLIQGRSEDYNSAANLFSSKVALVLAVVVGVLAWLNGSVVSINFSYVFLAILVVIVVASICFDLAWKKNHC